jgi:hypothetical protein
MQAPASAHARFFGAALFPEHSQCLDDDLRRFSQPHRHLSRTDEDSVGAIVFLPHPPVFDNRLRELLDFQWSILLPGRSESEGSRYTANSMLQVLEVHVCSEARVAILQSWIVPIKMSVRNYSIGVISRGPGW